MIKIKLAGFLLIATIIMGCSSKMPAPLEGVYPLKTKTLTIFDLYSEEYEIYYNVAEVVESKPENLAVDFDLGQLTEYRFGSFILGNNNQRTWFLMSKDPQGYWSDFYIDQNSDLTIKENERIKSFQSGQDKIKGMGRTQSMTMIPVRIKVSFKGLSGEIHKNLYFFMVTTVLTKKGASDLMVEAISATFLDGEINIATDETVKRMNVRLIDANGNGCFNDYGIDLIFIDLNNNDYYQKREGFKLAEFFDFSESTGEQKQLRIIVPPFPKKIAITGAGQDYDLADLEAQSDQEDEEDEALLDPGEEDFEKSTNSPSVASESQT
ncbi:MAG: hypothetical protein GXY86_14905 [Firmicutes bacterium]|nr:hypothetical protein [Bacillota bacterium]